MVTLCVQIGQCGNQLGVEFFDTMYRHICAAKNENFKQQLINMYFSEECQYNNNLYPIIEYDKNIDCKKSYVHYNNNNNNINCLNNFIARCILIDMEPKVIENCLHRSSSDKKWMESKSVTNNDSSSYYSGGGYNYSGENKKTKKNYDHDSGECSLKPKLKYICGLNKYYEPRNNLIKFFKKDMNSNKYVNNYEFLNENDGSNDENYEKNYDHSYFKSDNELKKKKKKKMNKKQGEYYFVNEWKYNNNNFIYGTNGSGNNWSYGFNVHAPNICEDFLNIINKELEKNETTECIDNILLFHSLAGGSGSGISSYLSYILKDEYPKINLI
ncbi:delta tubulin, putative, partial [Hepatocystis sp. ex Piliocolobus tephrosceles]